MSIFGILNVSACAIKLLIMIQVRFAFEFIELELLFKIIVFCRVKTTNTNFFVVAKIQIQDTHKKATLFLRFLFVRCLVFYTLDRITITEWSHADLFIRYGSDWSN